MTRTRILTALCILTIVLSPALCRAQQKTLISDTLFEADGSRASGTATITWPAFTSPDNFPIAQGTLTINIANGSISVQLVPTIGATPAGTSYMVAYFLSNSVNYTEYWTVPTTGPVTLTQVRTTPVPVPTTTFGEHQLTLGNGFQALLGIWRQSAVPVATAEGQCYWDLPTHAIKCTDQTLTFNALGGSDPSRVSKAGDTMSGSLLAASSSVSLGSSSQPFGAIFQNASINNGFTSGKFTSNGQGLQLQSFNPTVGNNTGDRRALDITVTADGTTSDPTFTNQTGLYLTMTSTNGQNDPDAAGKKSFYGILTHGNHYGAGQRFSQYNLLNCWGMGDCFETADTVNQWGGLNAAGDEGTGFRTMTLSQGQNLANTNVSSSQPARTVCNTTTTQAISKNIAAQQVTVVSTTGCNVGDWVVFDRASRISAQGAKIEAVKLTAVSSGVLSAVFTKDHVSGAPLTPGLKLNVNDSARMGQFRYLVNLSQPAYTTGTVSSVSGLTVTGSGTQWSANMVGGDSILPGCISFAADDYTSGPYSPTNVLRAWYPIVSATATSLTIAHFGPLGLANYTGNAPGSGAYTIRPCSEILIFDSGPAGPGNSVVLESPIGTWATNDAVEAVLSVDGFVNGQFMRLGWYTPGANLGSVYSATNVGAQTFSTAFLADQGMSVPGKSGFSTGLSISAQTKTPISLSGLSTSGIAINFGSNAGDNKALYWPGADAALYADGTTGDLVLTRSYSTNATFPLTFRLSPATTTATLLGNLTVALAGGAKIRLDNPSTAGFGYEFRNVTSSSIDSAVRGLDLYMDATNRTVIGVNALGQLGLNSLGAATLSANANSYTFSYAFETFNGVSSDRRYIHTRAVPNSGIYASALGTVPVEWQLLGTSTLNGGLPLFAGISTTGVLRFGNPSSGLVSLIASSVTAARSLTLPDASGVLALTTTPGTTGTALSWSATGGLNIPLASSGGVTAGLLGNSDYLVFSSKENALTFSTPISRSSNTISCPTCEVTGNKNIASGYAGLTGTGKLTTSQGQKVWAATDLTTYTSTSGSGTTALQTTVSAPAAGQVLTWSGTDWVNLTLPATAGHNLLSTTHSDTTPASVIRGDIISGQGSTVTWQRLALGISGRYLRSNGTDIAYSNIAAGGAGACAANQWIAAANDNAAPTCTQPAFSSLSGIAATTQLPAAVVYGNQNNTYSSGTQDFGAASVVLPKSSDPATPSTAQIWVNSGALKYRDNSGAPATQVVEIQSNKNAANGYAGLTASAVLGASQFPILAGDVTSAGGSLTVTLPNIVAAGVNTKITYNAKGQVTAGAQAQFSDVGGILGGSQFPALTGDVTTTAGSLATTLSTIVTAGTNTKITYNAKGQVTAGVQAQFTDIGGILGAIQFPALTGDVTTAAGSLTATLPNIVTSGANTKITYNAKGQVTAGAQAQFSDIGGILVGTQFPALTGDITTTAGSLTATLPNIVSAATNTKITYNAKGQVTGGTQAAAADLSNGTSGSGSIALATSPTITDLIVNQNANGDDTITGRRKTDTSPTGNLIHFQNAAANTDLWTVDVSGTLQAGTVPGARVNGSISGNSATATALAATPSQCGSNQFATGVTSSGNANCSQPSAGNLSNGTTGSGSVVLATSPTITTPTISGALGGNLDLGSNAIVVEFANDITTGTTVNQLAKLTGATSAAIKATTSDTSGIVGIVVAGAGTSGNAQISRSGRAQCAFDGGTIAGDYVQISSAVAGDCHDVGSSYPTSGQVLGRVLTTNGSAGTYTVSLQSGELSSPRIFVGGYGAVAVAPSTTTFGWAGAGNSGYSATESTRQFPVPVAGTARSMYCMTTSAQPSTGSVVATLRKNGASTALLVTIPSSAAAGNYSDLTDSVAFAAGDLISIQLANNSTSSSATIGACTWVLQ